MPVSTKHRMSDEDMQDRSILESRQRGITVVEIMVTLAIAAILIGLALPAFNAFVAQRTLTSQVNDFLVGVQYARSEAIRRSARVSLQSLDASDASNEWGNGYCVVAGNPGNCDDPLRTFVAIGDNTLNANGGAGLYFTTTGCSNTFGRNMAQGNIGSGVGGCIALFSPESCSQCSAGPANASFGDNLIPGPPIF